jgi:P-type conjugative transfer protein TrbG
MIMRLSPLALAVLTGCATTSQYDQAQYEITSEQMEAARQVIERPAAVTQPTLPVEYLYPDSPEIQRAVKEFQQTGRAPIVKDAQFITYPYGQHQPTIYCQPLRACDIELQAGEQVLNVAIGDPIRWTADPAFSGPANNLIPHVIIKPTTDKLATNAVITTNRRTYHLSLISRNNGDYARSVRFYYPQDAVARWADATQATQQERRNDVANLSVDSLNFNYGLAGDTPWRPVRAFDDGRHVYIQMPEQMRATEAPALFVLRNGENALVNYRVRGDYYVVDKLFDKAAMVVGVGRDQERVVISRVDEIMPEPKARNVAFADR